MVTRMWRVISARGSIDDLANAVATANTPHSTMSSSTATPSTIRANRVCRIFRSWKMREITGIEVTATAMPITRMSAVVCEALPISAEWGEWNQQHGDQEGKQRADSGKPRDLSPVIRAQQFASFSAGDEHQQQQSQPVDKRQNNIDGGVIDGMGAQA